MDAFFHILIAGFVIVAIILRIFKNPEELAIVALAISSTLPVITDGNALAFGPPRMNIRFEYTLVFLGLFLAFGKWARHYPPSHTPLNKAVRLMFLVYVISIPVCIYWGTPFGVRNVYRLVETYLFFFIIVRLTCRAHIPKLTNSMIIVGSIVAASLLLMTITQNPFLYKIMTGEAMWTAELAEVYGQVLGQNIGWLRYSIGALPVVATMCFVLFLLKKKKRILYGSLDVLFLVQIVASGQRSSVLALLAGHLMALLILSRNKHLQVNYASSFVMIFFVALIAFGLFAYTDILGARYQLLMYRTSKTIEWMSGEGQYMGHILTLNAINFGGWKAWLLGFGGVISGQIAPPRNYDINSPILMIYRFGLLGLSILLLMLWLAFRRALDMVINMDMLPEETAVVLAVIVYIAVWLPGSFIRGMAFSETFSMLSWFVLWLAWTEVIYRDYKLVYQS